VKTETHSSTLILTSLSHLSPDAARPLTAAPSAPPSSELAVHPVSFVLAVTKYVSELGYKVPVEFFLCLKKKMRRQPHFDLASYSIPLK
jgi:hypothetical protein